MIKNILWKIRNLMSIDGNGDENELNGGNLFLGVVVDTDDPLQMGRVRVYCADLNDDPKKVQHLPWAAYVSPYGGSIRNASFTRGHQKDNATTGGTTQYGFWGIPEMGANVLVACINGDIRRRVWLGCLYEHQETGALLTGVYDWGSSQGADGPLSAPSPYVQDRQPLQPQYDNLSEAFKGDKSSPEWKSRAADYSGMVNLDFEFGSNASVTGGERDSWVKDALGALGYDWTSFKNLGGYLTSKVVGLMTPGLHSISMDDRAFNSRIKLRTTAGHQIILDDSNERIYVSTYEGKSWIEMDVNGNIDIYADRRLSVRAKKDINFSTDETFRVKAKKGIYMYSGDTRAQAGLTEGSVGDGEIRFHATNNVHLYGEGDFYTKILGDVDFDVDGSWETFVDGAINFESAVDNINFRTPSHLLTMSGSFQIDTDTSFRLQASGSIQFGIGSGSGQLEITPSTITLDAPTVAFNDYGTTVTTIVTYINTLAAFHSLPGIIPVPQPVSADSMLSPSFTITEAEISPWTNRVPDHEPWPRVLMIDGDDTQNDEGTGYLDNVDWVVQYDNMGNRGREPIGKIEGDEEIERGDFWRR